MYREHASRYKLDKGKLTRRHRHSIAQRRSMAANCRKKSSMVQSKCVAIRTESAHGVDIFVKSWREKAAVEAGRMSTRHRPGAMRRVIGLTPRGEWTSRRDVVVARGRDDAAIRSNSGGNADRQGRHVCPLNALGGHMRSANIRVRQTYEGNISCRYLFATTTSTKLYVC